ncbi:MAG: hypothetical protein WD276_09400 [Actinomycetota bacterium]
MTLVATVLFFTACSAPRERPLPRTTPSSSAVVDQPEGKVEPCGPEAKWATVGCAESDWARSVARRAGLSFRNTGGSGSIVVQGGGTHFYLWLRQSGRPLTTLGWPLHDKIGGTRVYGYDDVDESPLAWHVGRVNVLVQAGPFETHVRPDDEVLMLIVRSSKRTPYVAGPGETSPWP